MYYACVRVDAYYACMHTYLLAYSIVINNGSIVQQNMDDGICMSCFCFEFSEPSCIFATSLNALESK